MWQHDPWRLPRCFISLVYSPKHLQTLQPLQEVWEARNGSYPCLAPSLGQSISLPPRSFPGQQDSGWEELEGVEGIRAGAQSLMATW